MRPAREASSRRASTTSRVTAPTSMGTRARSPRWVCASVSSASISRSCCSLAASARPQAACSEATLDCGSASATSISVRCRASGVRSSCEALATNCRCASNAASSRARSASKVSASSFSSSSGPVRASRSCRLLAEVCCAAAVMVRSGRSTRPATTQPRPIESTAMTASAIPDWTSRSVAPRRCAAWTAWDWSRSADGGSWPRRAVPDTTRSSHRQPLVATRQVGEGEQPRAGDQEQHRRRAWSAAAGWCAGAACWSRRATRPAPRSGSPAPGPRGHVRSGSRPAPRSR